jgi:hypothetical protein
LLLQFFGLSRSFFSFLFSLFGNKQRHTLLWKSLHFLVIHVSDLVLL